MIPLLLAGVLGANVSAGPAVADYKVRLTLTPVRGTIQVDLTAILPPMPRASATSLVLGRAYKIDLAEAGRRASVTVTETDEPFPGLQRVTIRFRSAAARPRLHLHYSGPLNPSGNPPLNMVTPALTELNLDSAWLPFRPDFSLGLTGTLHIYGLPPDAVTVAQGDIHRTGKMIHVRRHFPDVDFAFVASPQLKRASAEGFEIYAYDLNTPDVLLYRKHGPSATKFLERWLGPMPGRPARVVVVRRARGSGYARRGYIVVTEGGDAPEARRAKFLAHEFSHAWFSNASPVGEDRWIDESGAEYVGIRYVEEALGRVSADGLFQAKVEAAAAARPLLGGGVRGDAELYSKGPLLLRELEQRIGRGNIDRLLRLVAQRHIGTTAAWLSALAEVAGPDNARWFDSKLRSA